MSHDAMKGRLDEQILAMLETLDENDIRHQTLKSSVDFQSAWLELAEYMHEVEKTEIWRDWNYRSFFSYCANELRLTKALATKLLAGYQWIEEQAPEYLPRHQADDEHDFVPRSRPAPDVDMVSVLAKAHQEVQEERIPASAYSELRDAALRGEHTVSALRKEFREAVPEHLREEKNNKGPVHHLRRALTEVEKALARLGNEQEESDLLIQASALRDSIFTLVSTHSDEG